MKKILLLALLLLPVAYAQLDWSITEFRCGNKVLDQFELCEEDIEEGLCDELGTILEIDTACDTDHCTCLPRINKAFCGNNIREGVEVCDGTGDDRCAEYGKLINLTLSCNKKTCGCIINQTIPSDYNPATVEQLVNQSQSSAVCGNKKIERDEDCDPSNTLCTIRGEPGICNDKCKCVSPEMLGVSETPKENVTVLNASNITGNVSNVTVENVTAPVNVSKEPEKPGFFARLWQWFAALFS